MFVVIKFKMQPLKLFERSERCPEEDIRVELSFANFTKGLLCNNSGDK